MNKNGQQRSSTITLVLVIAALALLFVSFSSGGKTILEHREPADISKEESGTGLDLKLYDADGNEITIPDWFSTSEVDGAFTIVRHPPAPSCTVRTQCVGYDTNPNIGCWQGSCVLQDVVAMDLGVSVFNPASSELSFLSVAPQSATPVAFWTNLDKTAVGTLSPGQTASWQTTSPMSVGVWEGTQQTFSIVVEGTNQFTGEVVQASDSIDLAFDANPVGGFTVSIVSPI